MDRNTQRLLFFLLITRVLILILPWLTITLLFPEGPHLNFLNFTQISWNRWDALHYLYLAQNWYTNIGDAANFIVFFPLFPLLLKPLILIHLDPVISGIILSSTLFMIGSYFFYKLVALDFPERIVRWAVISVAIFPTSYFFNSPYTESLFFLIFSLTLYLARKGKWVLSGVLAGLGAATRPFGVLLLPTLLIEWLINKNKKWIQLVAIMLPTLVFVFLYLYLNKTIYGNPFEFQKILAVHWQKHLTSPISSILDSWKIAFSGSSINYVIMVGWAESLTITLSWILIPFAFKYLRMSWAVFYTLSIIFLSSTGFILSTPRYLLSVPPVFLLIALAEKNSFFKIVWTLTSTALFFYLAILFTRGQWAF
jgi:Gpi18-like mannosyltransferase